MKLREPLVELAGLYMRKALEHAADTHGATICAEYSAAAMEAYKAATKACVEAARCVTKGQIDSAWKVLKKLPDPSESLYIRCRCGVGPDAIDPYHCWKLGWAETVLAVRTEAQVKLFSGLIDRIDEIKWGGAA